MLVLFTRLYRVYTFYASPARRVVRKTIVSFFQDCLPCQRILEIGGGNAMMRSVLKTACRSEKYISSDIAPTDQTAVVCDAQQLPFPDNSMDVVASFEVMEHIPDTDRLISEMVRVLKSDGYIVMSVPFLYGRHDFQDFYRWTAQGLEHVLNLHGMEMRLMRNRGGTFLTITELLSLYIHSIFAPSSGWRATGMARKLYFGVMSILMFPLFVLSWFFFGLDMLIDRHSANPSGLVCIAQKKGHVVL